MRGNFMMFKSSKPTTVFCMSLAAVLIAGCGTKNKKETVYVEVPPAKTTDAGGTLPPASAPPATPTNTEEAQQKISIEVQDKERIEQQNHPVGPLRVEFRLKTSDGSPLPQQITYTCKLEMDGQPDTAPGQACTSPVTFPIQRAGQYFISIGAQIPDSNVPVEGVVLSAVVGPVNGGASGGVGGAGAGGGGQGPGPGNPGQVTCGGMPCFPGGGNGQTAMPVMQQVGDLFSVTIQPGFHMVSRTSTFDTPGFLNYKIINGGKRRDSAFPYAYDCVQPGAQFESIESIMMPKGRLDYCDITPPLSWNSGGNPVFNTFRWATMGTMSYNSIAIASDNSLSGFNGSGPVEPAMAKLYVNVFTNVRGRDTNNFQEIFATELCETVSRLKTACAGMPIEFLGNAPAFQGFFEGTAAEVPLFGCTVQRQGAFFVEIGAFPTDRVSSYMPASGHRNPWTRWISQRFTDTRAAEIVVELGPYPVAPIPMMVANSAQGLMLQSLQKLTPNPRRR